MLGLNGAFSSVVIKAQSVDALLRLYKTVPDAVSSQAEEWLLRIVLLTVDHANVRGPAEELLGQYVRRYLDAEEPALDHIAMVIVHGSDPMPDRGRSSSNSMRRNITPIWLL